MIGAILSRTMYGIAWGGIATFIALTILMITDTNPPAEIIWLNMLGSMIIGIYFGLASLIFIHEGWSPLKKTSLHFSCSIIVWFIIAFLLKWLPVNLWSILIGIGAFIVVYILFWSSYTLYYKKLEASLNDSLSKK